MNSVKEKEPKKAGFIREKLITIKKKLNSYFIERSEIIETIILSIASRKHMILVGDPGLAKTGVLKAFSKHIKGLRFFDYQMTPLTEIDSLLSKNKANMGQGIDKCEIALIDEFFKGPSPTLNSLLSIMNERIIYAPQPAAIPLISLFATSNEKPDKSSGAALLPLYDRFLLRNEVSPVKDPKNFTKLLNIAEEYSYGGIEINIGDLDLIGQSSAFIKVPEKIYNIMHHIREELLNKQVTVSDRRWRETIRIMQVNAFLNCRDEISMEDIKSIESSLWTFYSDIRSVKSVIKKLIT